jgi:Phage integrase, N-terminal SAM-like domain
MQQVSAEVWATLERRLDETRVPAPQRPDCRKWVRFYLDFCHKYGHRAASPTSLDPFLAKLASKNQSVAQRNQASAAVGLLLRAGPEPGAPRPSLMATPAPSLCAPLNSQPPVLLGSGAPPALRPQPPTLTPRVCPAPPQTRGTAQPPARPLPAQPGLPEPSRPRHQDRPAAPLPDTAVPDAQPAGPPAPGRGASWQQEYRDLEAAVLLRNYSTRTLEAYRFWIAKFQGFVRSRPIADLGTQEVRGFLSDLAVRHRVAAATQNQAFNALLFFYRHVLRREFGQLEGVVRAKRHRYVPVVLSHPETEAILAQLQPPYRLVGLLL